MHARTGYLHDGMMLCMNNMISVGVVLICGHSADGYSLKLISIKASACVPTKLFTFIRLISQALLT